MVQPDVAVFQYVDRRFQNSVVHSVIKPDTVSNTWGVNEEVCPPSVTTLGQASQSSITTPLPFFRMVPAIMIWDVFCIPSPCVPGAGCKTRLESKIRKLNR